MENVITILTTLYSYTAEEVISKIQEIPDDEDITIFLNSPGGDVYAGVSIISALLLRGGSFDVTVIGQASSMAPMFLAFARKRSGVDLSSYMLHRAASYYERYDDVIKAEVMKVSKQMQKKLEAVIDNEELKKIKGVGLKEIFEAEEQTDYFFTSQEAKKIGLIDNRIKLNKLEATHFAHQIAATLVDMPAEEKPETKPIDNKNEDNMTLAELKAKHPELFAEVQETGIKAERTRVAAFMAYSKIDPERVAKAIKEGEEMNAAVMSEFQVKMMSAEYLKKMTADSQKDVETDDKGDKTEEQLKLEAFNKELDEQLKGGTK